MPIEVEGPDGTVAEFPDGTPAADIQRAMRAKFGGPAQPPARPAPAPARPAAQPPAKRSPFQRFTDNLVDAAMSNPTVADIRAGFVGDRDSPLQPASPLSIMNQAADAADRAAPIVRAMLGMPEPAPAPARPAPAKPGIVSEVGNLVLSAPMSGAPMTRTAGGAAGIGAEVVAPGVRTQVRAGEIARRQQAQATGEADPFYKADGGLVGKAVAGAATLGGQVVGSMLDPQNLVGGEGLTVVRRLLAEGAANAVGDVQAQTADVGAGIQQDYNPVQTAASFGAGVGIRSVFEAAGRSPAVAQAIGDFFTRKGIDPATVSPETLPPDVAGEMLLDPDIAAILKASNVDPASPQFQPFVEAAQRRRAAEAARVDAPAIVAQAAAEAAPGGQGLAPETVARMESLQAAPNVAPTTRTDIEATLLGDRDPATIRTTTPPTAPDVIPVDAAGRADIGNVGTRAGADSVDAGMAAQRKEAEDAFRMADIQRRRAEPGTRDTQTAGLPKGPEPQQILLDDGFPVRVVEEQGNGKVRVQRYDPRTGALDPEAVPYDTSYAALSRRNYTPEPRRAQDFGARDGLERAAPEQPRMPGQPVTREPTKTYQMTPEDAPPADGPFSGETGRPPLPEQPGGPGPWRDQPGAERAQRFADEAQARARWEQRQQEQQYQEFSQRAREQYAGSDAKTSSTAAPADAESRFPTDEFGFVKSDKGGPIRFGDQKQTAKWILNVGQKQSPDQVFEIANHPKGGFTARETGRSTGSAGEKAGGGAQTPPPRPASEDTGGVGSREATAPPAAPEARAQAAEITPMPEKLQTSEAPAADARPSEAPAPKAPDAPDAPDAPAGTPAGKKGAGKKEVWQRSRAEVVAEAGDRAPKGSAFTGYGARRDAEVSAGAAHRNAVEDALLRGEDVPLEAKYPEHLTKEEFLELQRREAQASGRPFDKTFAEQEWDYRQDDPALRNAKAEWKSKLDAARDAKPVEERDWKDLTPEQRDARSKQRDEENFAAVKEREPDLTREQYEARKKAGMDFFKSYLESEDGAAPDAPDGNPGTKLYSGLDPEAVNDLLLKPGLKALKREIDETAAEIRQLRADAKSFGENASISGALDTMGRTVRKIWWTNTAAMRSIAAKYPDVPEIRELADAIGTDPGRGRKVAQTFERAVQMRAMGMANRLANLLGQKIDPAFERKVADILAGRRRPVTGTKDADAARRIRTLLDEQHDYMTAAGLEVGYVKGRYFPRVVDTEKVLKNPAAFQEAASRLYRKMGMDAKDAKVGAEEWYNRVLGVTDNGFAAGTPASKHTKGRTLPAEADTILADFYHVDPRENLASYFRQTSRAAEFTRRFGKGGEKASDMFNEMLKKGVSADDVNALRGNFESAVGTLYATRRSAEASALGWIQTAGVLRLLPRAVISSAAEGLAVGVRAHDVGAGFRAVADSYAQIFGFTDAADIRQGAEALGIVGDAMNDLVISAQFGDGVNTQAQQKLLARFFRVTHLHQITEAQRLAAFRVGQGMMRTLFQDLDGKRAASAKRLLAELGMEEPEARGVAKWLDKQGDKPELTRLTGDEPEALAYRTALQRFVDESIQNPTGADRPQWANHPYGRLAYGITSFMFSFTRNVLLRSVRETGEGAFGKGYSLEDRARLVAPTIALAVLVAAQSQVSEWRDALLNPGGKKEQSNVQKIVANLSRAGVFGNADPFVNLAMSARYKRELTSALTGPYLTAYLDSLNKMTFGLLPKSFGGPNSPNTNNSEWQASKAAYESIISPLIAAAASYAPGGPMLRVGYGAGTITATSPGAARKFADAVAGPRDVAPGAAKADSGGSDMLKDMMR